MTCAPRPCGAHNTLLRKHTMSFRSIALAAASLLAAAQAQALTAETQVNNVVGWDASLPLVTNAVGFVRATSDNSVGMNGLTGRVSVGGMAEYGTAKAYASGSGDGFYGLSQARWLDWLTIDGGALNGQRGVLSFAIAYDWRLDYDPLAPFQGGALATITLDLDAAQVGQIATVDCSPGWGCNHLDADTLLTSGTVVPAGVVSVAGATGIAHMELPFTFGATSFLDASLSAFVGSSVGRSDLSVPSGSVFADQSLRWGGILSVKDASGQAVAYSVTSASGLDYTQAVTSPVPEPGTYGLLCAGLLGLAAWRRRQLRG